MAPDEQANTSGSLCAGQTLKAQVHVIAETGHVPWNSAQRDANSE